MTRQDKTAHILKGYPKEIILKDGTGVTLRPLKAGDEQALFDMFKRLSDDDLWFLNHDVTDRELVADWVRTLDPNRVVSIVALLEGRIVANAVLMRKAYGAKRHIGKIRLSVDPAYRDKRLGTWMLLDLVNLAMAVRLQLMTMRLVVGRDSTVINGVRKLDFREEAVIEDYVLDMEGNPHDLVIMTKRLPYEFTDF
ncbi:MAG: GNAT family N-acetyltransferase [Deltaproteobacteria bacterium]|nr:GNAT family N-acetyltransferase [Deltaproteobacteria bacterium]